MHHLATIPIGRPVTEVDGVKESPSGSVAETLKRQRLS